MSISTIIFIVVFILFIIRKLGSKKEVVAQVPPIVHKPNPFLAENKNKQPHANNTKSSQATNLNNTSFSDMSTISEKKLPRDEKLHNVVEISTDNDFTLHQEDLKKAIVYAEIINRKYE